MLTGHHQPMSVSKYSVRRKHNPRCRTRCANRVLIDEGPTWAVWLCTSCHHRHTETEAQLGLFARLDGIPEQPGPD